MRRLYRPVPWLAVLLLLLLLATGAMAVDALQTAKRIEGELQRTRDHGELRIGAMAPEHATQVAWAESGVADERVRNRARSRATDFLRENLRCIVATADNVASRRAWSAARSGLLTRVL